MGENHSKKQSCFAVNNIGNALGFLAFPIERRNHVITRYIFIGKGADISKIMGK
jgi:hypothetical protein